MAALRLSRDEALQGVAAFLDAAGAAHADWKNKDDAAVGGAVSRCEAKLASQAVEIARAVASAGEGLLPCIEAGEALPEVTIIALNSALEACDQKSEVIPAKLAAAKPGDKLYAALVLKVKKVFSLDEQAWAGKLRATLEAGLRSGGQDMALDTERQVLQAEREEALWQVANISSQALAQSDHQPIYHTIKLSDDCSWDMMSWNILEYPAVAAEARHAAPDAVIDGISPVCDALLSILGKKDATLKQLLVQAMRSRKVVEEHGCLILQEVHEALAKRHVQTVLLQEVNQDMRALLQKECDAAGWNAHFSTAVGNGKCDAMTCVISQAPFDEVDEFEQSEGTKLRYFAAVRQGSTWILSCHAPGEVLTKQQIKDGVPSHGHAARATRIFRQMAERFLTDGVKHLCAGGDWNTNVRVLQSNLVAEPCSSQIDLHAPDGATCLDVEWPIDALLLAHR